MHLNRTTALMLVTALAGGCVKEEKVDGTGGAAGQAGGGTGGTAGGNGGTAGSSGGEAGSSAGSAGTSNAGSAGEAGNAGNAGSGNAGAAGSGGCDDTQGSAVDCSSIEDSCWAKSECVDAPTFYKAAVAEKLGKCVVAEVAAETCDLADVYGCKDDAAKSGCPDDTADPDCTTIITTCTAIALADCKEYLNGMTARGRTEMVTCMTDGDFCNLYSCNEGLWVP
jgi:hypothetical protein